MSKSKRVVEGPFIHISQTAGRFEIIKRVVTIFVDFEKDKKGKGIQFKYPVEKLSSGERLYIHRPGVKWNFDFKVEIPANCGIEQGRHDQIAIFLRNLKIRNKQAFNNLWKILSKLYHCENNDVDFMLKKSSVFYNEEPKAEVLLKIIKWLFIMEDIIYWHYQGRAFLYNFFVYVISETNEVRLTEILNKIRERKIKPERIKKLLKEMDIEWEDP